MSYQPNAKIYLDANEFSNTHSDDEPISAWGGATTVSVGAVHLPLVKTDEKYKYVRLGAVYAENPAFTGNTTVDTDHLTNYGWVDGTGWEVSASSLATFTGTTFAIWKGFNKSSNNSNDCWVSGVITDQTPQWLRIKYPYPVSISYYEITSRHSTTGTFVRFPTIWVLQGSNDGNVETDPNNNELWEDLEVVRTESSWSSSITKKFSDGVNIKKNEYRYYQLFITGSGNPTGSVEAPEGVAIGNWTLYTKNGSTSSTIGNYIDLGTQTWLKSYETPKFTSYTGVASDYESVYGWKTDEGWRVSASTNNLNGTDIWKAFNKTIIDTNDCWLSTNNGAIISDSNPQWLQIEYPHEVSISSYAIGLRSDDTLFPTSWRLEGSTDGITWIDLENLNTGQVASVATDIKNQTFTTTNTGFYKYFRLFITSASANSVAIGNWSLSTRPGFTAVGVIRFWDVKNHQRWFDFGNVQGWGYFFYAKTSTTIDGHRVVIASKNNVNLVETGLVPVGNGWHIVIVRATALSTTEILIEIFANPNSAIERIRVFRVPVTAAEFVETTLSRNFIGRSNWTPFPSSGADSHACLDIRETAFYDYSISYSDLTKLVEHLTVKYDLLTVKTDFMNTSLMLANSTTVTPGLEFDKKLTFGGVAAGADSLKIQSDLDSTKIGALDTIDLRTNAVCALGTRRLFNNYEGSHIRARRESDNREADIRFDKEGHIREIISLKESPEFTSDTSVDTDYLSKYGWETNAGWNVTASSVRELANGFTFDAWYGFNKSNANPSDCWQSGTTVVDGNSVPISTIYPQWLRIEYPYKVSISSYEITIRNNDAAIARGEIPSLWFPTKWVLQGSNDATSWVNLEEERTYNQWVSKEIKEFSDGVNIENNEYKYYQLLIRGSQNRIIDGPGTIVNIANLSLFTVDQRSTELTEWASESEAISVSTLYDQSGNNNNFKQTVYSNQPILRPIQEFSDLIENPEFTSPNTYTNTWTKSSVTYGTPSTGSTTWPLNDPEFLVISNKSNITNITNDTAWKAFNKIHTGIENRFRESLYKTVNGVNIYRPVWLGIRYPKPVLLQSYSFTLGDTETVATREKSTPKDWTIDGSNDGKSWTTVQRYNVNGIWYPSQDSASDIMYDFVTDTTGNEEGFTHWRMNIESVTEGDFVQIAELIFRTREPNNDRMEIFFESSSFMVSENDIKNVNRIISSTRSPTAKWSADGYLFNNGTDTTVEGLSIFKGTDTGFTSTSSPPISNIYMNGDFYKNYVNDSTQLTHPITNYNIYDIEIPATTINMLGRDGTGEASHRTIIAFSHLSENPKFNSLEQYENVEGSYFTGTLKVIADPPIEGIHNAINGIAPQNPHNVFDKNTTTQWINRIYQSTTFKGTWIGIQYPEPVFLASYKMSFPFPGTTISRMPRSWRIQGFNTQWVTVSTIIGYTHPSSYNPDTYTINFNIDGNNIAYSSWRIFVDDVNGAGDFVVNLFDVVFYTSYIPIDTVRYQLNNLLTDASEGILDKLSCRSDTAAAFALKRLFNEYTGPQIRIRRPSDNVEADVWFNSYGVPVQIKEYPTFNSIDIVAQNNYTDGWVVGGFNLHDGVGTASLSSTEYTGDGVVLASHTFGTSIKHVENSEKNISLPPFTDDNTVNVTGTSWGEQGWEASASSIRENPVQVNPATVGDESTFASTWITGSAPRFSDITGPGTFFAFGSPVHINSESFAIWRLFDKDPNSRTIHSGTFPDTGTSADRHVGLRYPLPVVLKAYTFQFNADNGRRRAPAWWRIQGSDTGVDGTWVTVDERGTSTTDKYMYESITFESTNASNFSPPEKQFPFDIENNTQAFTHWRVHILDIYGPRDSNNFSMFGDLYLFTQNPDVIVYDVWRGLNRSAQNELDVWHSNGSPATTPQWIQVRSPEPIIAKFYRITSRNTSSSIVWYPTQWRLEGSNSSSNEWTVLDSVTLDPIAWNPAETKTFAVSYTSSSAFTYYRLTILNSRLNNNDATNSFVAIADWQLFVDRTRDWKVNVPTKWNIQASNDNSKWVVIQSFTKDDWANYERGKEFTFQIKNAKSAYKYWRMNITRNGNTPRMSLVDYTSSSGDSYRTPYVAIDKLTFTTKNQTASTVQPQIDLATTWMTQENPKMESYFTYTNTWDVIPPSSGSSNWEGEFTVFGSTPHRIPDFDLINAFDKTTTTRMVHNSGTPFQPRYIGLHYPIPVVLKAYSYQTNGASGRAQAPGYWKIQGSSIGGTNDSDWVDIDEKGSATEKYKWEGVAYEDKVDANGSPLTNFDPIDKVFYFDLRDNVQSFTYLRMYIFSNYSGIHNFTQIASLIFVTDKPSNVVTWYDQGPGKFHLTQSEPTYQPLLTYDEVLDNWAINVSGANVAMNTGNIFSKSQVTDMMLIAKTRELSRLNNFAISFSDPLTTGDFKRFTLNIPYLSSSSWTFDPGDVDGNRVISAGGITAVGEVARFYAYKSSSEGTNGLNGLNVNGFKYNSSSYTVAFAGKGMRIGSAFNGTRVGDHNFEYMITMNKSDSPEDFASNVFSLMDERQIFLLEGGDDEIVRNVDGILYKYHVFKQSGELVVKGEGIVECLIVAGGGGGGCNHAGGGGAGGLIHIPEIRISKNTNITVGAGGIGGGKDEAGVPLALGAASRSVQGRNGGDSSFGNIIAKGGGGGGNRHDNNSPDNQYGKSGGSGGGSGGYASALYNTWQGGSGILGQGKNGGSGMGFQSGGGGGGAGEEGENGGKRLSGTARIAGKGGDGLSFSQFANIGINYGTRISEDGWFAGGGGGSVGNSTDVNLKGVGGKGGGGDGGALGSTGIANTGGGGGGGRGSSNVGFNGGSGIVIVRYKISNIVTENLELWYDPYYTSGNQLIDLSNNERNGTLQGGATINADSQIVLDGSPQYVSTSYAPNLDNNTLYSFELWFWDNLAGGFNDNTALITNYNTFTGSRVLFHISSDGTINLSERNGSAGQGLTTTISITDGTWKHLVAVATATRLLIYINGSVNVLTTTDRVGGVITSGQNISIGGNHLSRYQTCRLGAVRIYRGKALTAEEVLQNYNDEKDQFRYKSAQ